MEEKGNEIERVIIRRPNCLKVDKAITLFKSNSKSAPRPAINIVKPETNNKTLLNQYLISKRRKEIYNNL